jgi:hypothetical protein
MTKYVTLYQPLVCCKLYICCKYNILEYVNYVGTSIAKCRQIWKGGQKND